MLGIFLLLLRGCDSRLSIVSSTDETHTLVKSEEEATLWCETNKPWFLCVWRGPAGLAITKTMGQESCDNDCCAGKVVTAEAPDPRISLVGSGSTCWLSIKKIRASDGGSYSCVLADKKDVQTVTQNITLQVGVGATVKWMEGYSVRYYEGEKMNITCQSQGGHPRPSLVIRTRGNVNITVSLAF